MLQDVRLKNDTTPRADGVDLLRGLLQRHGYVISRCYEDDGYIVCAVKRCSADKLDIVRFGNISLDRLGRLALIAGRPIRLTELEAALFEVLLVNYGRVVRIDELMAAVWPGDTAPTPRGRLYTLASTLRRKLEGNALDLKIEAARNGYRLWASDPGQGR